MVERAGQAPSGWRRESNAKRFFAPQGGWRSRASNERLTPKHPETWCLGSMKGPKSPRSWTEDVRAVNSNRGLSLEEVGSWVIRQRTWIGGGWIETAAVGLR